MNLVRKPWGYEYLAYENEDVGLWFLHIAPGQSTSMHCHPKKTTGLIILQGEAEVSFLSDSRPIKALSKVMIRRGLFHSTKAVSDKGVFLFEIETPKDKNDLVRLNDKYGRSSMPYEGREYEEKRTNECLWINEPALGNHTLTHIAECSLKIETTSDVKSISDKKDTDLLMFLKGGLVKNINGRMHCVTVPGDVGYAHVVKQVAKQVDGVEPRTIIMTITKNEN